MANFRVNTRNDLPRVGEMLGLSREQVVDMQAVSAVLPFKVNDYVLEELIDRDDLPHDPIFQLTFPQSGMLAEGDFNRMRDLVTREQRARVPRVLGQHQSGLAQHAQRAQRHVLEVADGNL